MSEPWLIYGLIFLAVAIAVQLVQAAFAGMMRQDRRVAKRFSALDAESLQIGEIDVLRRKPSGGLFSGLVFRLQVVIVQAGASTTLPRLGMIVLGIWLVLLLLPLPWSLPARIMLSGSAAFLLAYGHLALKRARRIARFGEWSAP